MYNLWCICWKPCLGNTPQAISGHWELETLLNIIYNPCGTLLKQLVPPALGYEITETSQPAHLNSKYITSTQNIKSFRGVIFVREYEMPMRGFWVEYEYVQCTHEMPLLLFVPRRCASSRQLAVLVLLQRFFSFFVFSLSQVSISHLSFQATDFEFFLSAACAHCYHALPFLCSAMSVLHSGFWHCATCDMKRVRC